MTEKKQSATYRRVVETSTLLQEQFEKLQAHSGDALLAADFGASKVNETVPMFLDCMTCAANFMLANEAEIRAVTETDPELALMGCMAFLGPLMTLAKMSKTEAAMRAHQKASEN